MKQFRLVNNITGWIVFIIAAATYLLTMEPTASFWDCPEFISTAFKLEVGHPPGAPFFMLLGHFFSLFTSDVMKVAFYVNALSALASAFTILFLFWTITHLARKVVHPTEGGKYSLGQVIGIMGAGAVGALTYTFTDSFWFSAVEGEVYATSAVFTAIVFWAILKWEDVANQPHADRWIIFIAYMMGLSIGVHLLNLLTIPAIVLVYYFKKFEFTYKGMIIALLASFGILSVVMYGVVPGVMTVASWFELWFVNGLGFGFNTGFLAYCILTFAALIWTVYETFVGESLLRSQIALLLSVTLLGIPFIGESIGLGVVIILGLAGILFFVKKINIKLLNTIAIALMVITIGYSSYAIIVIRSAANPPMDQNSPDNVFALKSYLNREQYGDRPLLYGQYYNAEVEREIQGDYCVAKINEGANVWSPQEKVDSTEKDKYIVSDKKRDYVYNPKFCTLFPRMYSPQPNHVEGYKIWGGITGKSVPYSTCGHDDVKNGVPTFGENLQFFFTYQIGYMYLRYFAWNFIGRQNDIQGTGEVDKGSVITGFKFIDNRVAGDQDTLPSDLRNNKGRNVYYMLPFLLGILGIAYLFMKGKKGEQSFWITTVLFFMTGLAIVLYLNQTPYQPRERDYAYAGSFYAFAIWIGFGVLGLMALLQKILKNKIVAGSIASLLCLFIPVQMAGQNWDDHDRSNRYTCRDFGYNYLISCAPNAIIFTNGDNDTFPLWYLQEVEGVRPDVRVCNLSYLQTDWYIDQMRRKAYESDPLPIEWKRYQYVQGVRDIAETKNILPSMDAKTAIKEYVLNPDLLQDGVAMFPTDYLTIPVNKDEIVKLGIVKSEKKDSVLSQLGIKLKPRLYKHELMILEMLSQNEWKRPIYFSVTVGSDMYMGLDRYLQLEGLASRIVPIDSHSSEGSVNTDLMFDNMVHKFKWGNIADPKVYLDENNLRMCRTFRLMFYQLVDALIKEGKKEKALEALDYCRKVIPPTTVKDDYISSYFATQYYTLGKPEKGDAIMESIAKNSVEYINWYAHLTNPQFQKSSSQDFRQNMAILQSIIEQCKLAERTEIVKKYEPIFSKYMYAVGE